MTGRTASPLSHHRKSLIAVTALSLALIAAPAHAGIGGLLDNLLNRDSDTAEDVETARLIVTRDESAGLVGEILSHVVVKGVFGDHEVLEVPLEHLEGIKARLERLPGVLRVEKDETTQRPEPDDQEEDASASDSESSSSLFGSTSSSGFNDPQYRNQHHFKDVSSSNRGASSIESALEYLDQERRMRIAVVDSGFHEHGDFQWSGGYNFDDNDSRGPSRGTSFATSPGYDQCNENHGQYVSSVIGAPQNSGSGIAGIVDADFYGVRVGDCNGGGYLTDLARGVRWAAGDSSVASTDIDAPANIINISMAADMSNSGGSCPSYMQSAVNYARDQGAIVVVSAGNWNNVSSENIAPANCRGVVTVGAVDRNGNKASFSSSGGNLAFSNLGVSVPVQDIDGTSRQSGTSFSAPIVSGILAAFWQQIPELTADEVIDIALDSTTDFASTNGEDMGAGILNAMRMVENAISMIDQAEFEVKHPLDGDCQRNRIATHYNGRLNACDLREVHLADDALDGNRYAVIYEIDNGDTLRASNGRIVQNANERVFMVRDWNPDRRYGLQICDTPDGEGCDNDILIDLELDQTDLPSSCSE